MQFLVKNVKVYARDPYSNKIYQYLVEGQLKSGLQIELFDFKRFNLTAYKDQQVKVLVFAMIEINTISSEFKRIKGKFIKDCPTNVVREWLKYKPNLDLKYYSALQTQDGIFLIDRINPDHYSMDYDGNLIVDIVRFDLFAWHPNEE